MTDDLRALIGEATLKMKFWTRVAARENDDHSLRRAAQWAAIVSALLARAEGDA